MQPHAPPAPPAPAFVQAENPPALQSLAGPGGLRYDWPPDKPAAVIPFELVSNQQPGGYDFRDGNLGAGILTRFNVTLDYAHARMLLEPSGRFGEPFEHDMSGMVFDPAADGGIAVRRVVADSPAEQAGIAPGDVVLEIDGRPAGQLGRDAIRDALTLDGAEVEIRVRRGEDIRVVRIRLRRLL